MPSNFDSTLLDDHSPTAHDLVLRVRGTRYDGQEIRLAANKCTIGSDPHCTLRLNASGVQPVHCLIVRGAERTILRPWTADTRLNGQKFADAALVDGDRIGIGPIEFEVVGDRRPPARMATAIQEPAAVPTETQFATLKAPISDPSPRQVSVAHDQLLLARQQGRRRVRGLVVRLREAGLRLAEWKAQRQSLGREEESLRVRAGELEADRQAFQCQQQNWDAQLAATNAQMTEWAAQIQLELLEIDERRQQLNQQQSDLAEMRRRWNAELQAASEELANARVDLRQQAEQSLAKQAASQAEVEAQIEQLCQCEAELDQRQRDQALEEDAQQRARDVKQAELQACGEAIEARQVELESQQQTLEGREAELRLRQQALDSLQAELELRQQELDSARQEFETSERRQFDERSRLSDELDRRGAELAAGQDRHDENVASFEARRATWEMEQSQLREQLAEGSQRLQQQLAELDDQRRTFAVQQDQWQGEQSLWNAEAARQASDLEHQRIALLGQQEAWRAQEAEMLAQQANINSQAVEMQSREEQARQLHDAWQAQQQHFADQLAARDAELQTRGNELERNAAVLERQRVETEGQWQAVTSTEAAAEVEQFRQQAADLELQRQSLENLRCEQQQTVDRRMAALDAQACHLEEQLQALSEMQRQVELQRDAWQTEQAQQAADLEDRRGRLDRAEAEFEAVRSRHPAPAAEVELQTEEIGAEAPIEPENAGEPSMEQPEHDIFARLRALALLKDSSDGHDSPNAAEPQNLSPAAHIEPEQHLPDPEPVTQPGHEAPASTATESEEESIEAYMARLLNRTRGSASNQASAAPAAATAEPTRSEATPMAAPRQPEIPPDETPLTSLPARAAAPESNADFSAMRALANQSARAAIHQHQRKRSSTVVWKQLGYAAAVISLGGGLVWWSRGALSPTIYAGLAVAAIGLFFAARAMLNATRLSAPHTAADTSASEASSPDEARPAH